MAQNGYLDFEKPIAEVENQLATLSVQVADKSDAVASEMRRLKRDVAQLKRKIYSNLTRWQTVQVARHPDRPMTGDYIDLVVEDFVELHGDRHFGEDRAVRCGFGKMGGNKLMLVGHHKGRTTREKVSCYFGCAHPEGYRKALSRMQLAEKFGLPVVCLIDTPGAYPGIGAEERGQAQSIATNLMAMSLLRTPIICIVIGEGGSGGALGIGVGDRVSMLQHAYYSVISPEGCAAILWRSGDAAPQAAEALKLTARDLAGMGIIDDVIPEPLGGAHRDPRATANTLKTYVTRYLRELKAVPIDDLVAQRYEKFRRIGSLSEAASDTAESPGAEGTQVETK